MLRVGTDNILSITIQCELAHFLDGVVQHQLARGVHGRVERAGGVILLAGVVGHDAAVLFDVGRPGLDVGVELAARADKDEVCRSSSSLAAAAVLLLLQPGQEEEGEERGGESVDLDCFFPVHKC